MDLKEKGIVYQSDILIIGGSISGLTAAIKIKENNKDLDVLVVDKGAIGYSGQAAKAGNGILGRRKEQSVDDFMEYSIKTFGEYLNDQDYLRMHYSNIPDYLEYLIKWGVNISKNPDGTLKTFPLENNLWCQVGIELKNIRSLKKQALKVGVRLLSYVQVFELLTDENGKVIGGTGIDSYYNKFHIFRAKAVGLATNGVHFKKMGGMFMGYGSGIGSAFRVGAEMKNAEFSTEVDCVSKGLYTPVYGSCNIICNKDGVNISNIYAPDRVEVSPELVLGMYKEIQEGRGPLYADFSQGEDILKEIGGVGHTNDQRLFPDKHHWVELMGKKAAMLGKPVEYNPEVTVRMNLQAECLSVDMEQKTNVEGLWGIGKISGMGCGYIGFVRGDGLGYAVQSGLRAADSMSKYVEGRTFEEVDPDQVDRQKEKLYAPLFRESPHHPQEIFSMIEAMAFHIDLMLAKTDRRIKAVLANIEKMKEIVPLLSANDAHSLAKCHEAAECILGLELIYTAALERKESRGGRYRHYRVDYPERDDKNWLKWIILKQGKDGGIEVSTKDLPMERYKFKPEGWEPSVKAE